MTELETALRQAREALDRSEPLEAFAALRFFLAAPELGEHGEEWTEAWTLFAEVADEVVGPPLGDQARRLADNRDAPTVLYDFGYEAIEVGLPDLAAGVLHRLNDLESGVEQYVTEYVVALESLGSNDLAVETLEAVPSLLEESFMCRYLLAFNAVMSGEPEKARAIELQPAGHEQEIMAARIERFLARIDGLAEFSSLHDRDLRGWQFVTTGSVLLHLSPHGFDEGMNGRYAFVQDSYALCRLGLQRLKAVLEAWEIIPPRVFFVDERGSKVLAHAAADMLSVPVEEYPAEGTDQQGLVVVYDLDLVDPATLYSLHQKRPNQPLFAHAACWVAPPAFAPDFHTFQYQSNVPPWGEQMRYDPETEEMATTEPDSSTDEEFAERVLAATPTDEEVDTLDDLLAFVRVAAELPEDAAPTALVDRVTRSRFWDSSPVKSSQFA